MYRCEAKTVSEFIRHLAVNYVSRGYFFYVRGEIPAHKDPARVDAKIIHRYGIGISKWVRHRRRRDGWAGVQYLRYRRHFVILATHGRHAFFSEEGKEIRDFRRSPLQFGGYSVGSWQGGRDGRVSVRIAKEHFVQLREYLLARAKRASVEDLLGELSLFAFPPFAPVRRQLFFLVRQMNEARQGAGLEGIPLRAAIPTWSERGIPPSP